MLDMIEEHLPRHRGTVVLHWFTGGKRDMQRAAALGCYFSVNAEMTRSDRRRIHVTEMPLDRILTETTVLSLKWKAGRRSRQTSD